MDIQRQNILDADFFKEYEQTNPYLVLGLIIISFGLYIINWIYLKNREFQLLDTDSPNPNRGAIILMFLPFAWFFSMISLKYLIFSPENLALGIIEIVGWGFIIFLMHKYILDFCLSFGRITKTYGALWFVLFFIGGVGILGTAMGYYLLSPLLFFLIITIPAMQAELNTFFTRHTIKKEKKIFYY